MTEEIENPVSSRAKRPIYLSPWLVALAALVLYAFTLNHWVTFRSLPLAAQVMGWEWHSAPLAWRPNPQYQPLYLLLTLPLQWLPADWRITALNGLAALCAALTLAVLARSVKLLPHDRTKDQRVRVMRKDALLSVRAAFLPAAFAVALLAGQLTFWENAVSGTGEMVDLLLFAFLILCLLEYRHTRREWWLSLFTFVYGLGVANNWAMIGFFPCFLAALIWIKGLAFFDWRFALRLIGWGALGLLLYTVVPILGVIHRDGGFWEILHQKLAEQKIYLTRMPRYFAAIAALPSLVPLIFAGIHWPSSEGELNPGARDLTTVLFRLLHVVFLAVGVLMFFDFAISASPRKMGLGVFMGAPGFLSFYYLGALSVGYFTGYTLLVFGKEVQFRWGQATGLLRFTNLSLTALFAAAAVLVPAVLFYKNYQGIQDLNKPVVAQFGNEMARSLPPKSAFVVADEPSRLYLAMGAAQRLGLTNQYVFIESRELIHREYLRYLADHYPSFRKELISPDTLPEEISLRQAADLLEAMAKRGTVYYLHPSFGAYFERVYMTPSLLGGYLNAYPTSGTVLQVLSPVGLTNNEAYWNALENGPLKSLPDLAEVGQDGLPLRSADAVRIAGYYSQLVNNWGVELQKATWDTNLAPQVRDALLREANSQFSEAIHLNTNNIIARLNREYNAVLRHAPPPVPLVTTAEMAAEMGSPDVMLNRDGPVDVPSLGLQVGRYFAQPQYRLYRQAVRIFLRCLELVPDHDYPQAKMDLARTYIDMGVFDPALTILQGIPDNAGVDPLERVRLEAMAYAKKNNFAQADKLLTEGQARYPKAGNFSGVRAEFYRLMGYSALYETNSGAAGEKVAAGWFQKSLDALDEELNWTLTSSESTTHELEIPRINRDKTEMQMALKDYSNAIITATAMLHQQPANLQPLLNRAICELLLGRLDDAKNDYLALEKSPEPSYIVYWGLAQIAQKRNDKKSEIHYDNLYLKNAPTNALEYAEIARQLHKLEEGH